MDRAAFFDHLDHLAEQRHRVPCRGTTWHTWTSDTHADQQHAAAMCSMCPALKACREYITNNPERAGVYAGTTPRDRGEKQ